MCRIKASSMIRYNRSRRPEERVGRVFVAVGVLTVALGLTFSSAAASGENTTALLTSPSSGSSSSTFIWTYQFNQNGGHDLSNIAISFCTTDILSHVVSASPAGEKFLVGDVPGGHLGFGPGIKFETTAVSGTLTVVFDQAFTANGTMQIQSHSGDGQVGDQTTGAIGPGPCGTTTTVPVTTTTVPVTTTTVPVTTTTVPVTTTTTVPVTTTTVPVTTTTVPVTTTTVPVTTTTVPATTTTVPATTTTVPATTTTAPATTTTTVATAVLSEVLENDDPGGGIAFTGFTGMPLIAVGLFFVVLGAALIVGGMLRPADA